MVVQKDALNVNLQNGMGEINMGEKQKRVWGSMRLGADIVMDSPTFRDYWCPHEKILKRDLPVLKKVIRKVIVETGAYYQTDLTRAQINQLADVIFKEWNEFVEREKKGR